MIVSPVKYQQEGAVYLPLFLQAGLLKRLHARFFKVPDWDKADVRRLSVL